MSGCGSGSGTSGRSGGVGIDWLGRAVPLRGWSSVGRDGAGSEAASKACGGGSFFAFNADIRRASSALVCSNVEDR